MSDEVARPDRPLMPPLLWALVAVLAVSRAALRSGADAGALAAGSVVAGLATCAVLLVLMKTRARPAAAAALVVVAAAACAGISCSRELAAQRALEAALSGSPVSAWELVLEGDMSEGASGWRGRARVAGTAGRVWLLADEPLGMGETLRCVGRFSPNEEGEWGASSRAQGLAGTVRAVRVLDRRAPTGARGAVVALRSAVLASIDAGSSDARALLAGTICGSTTAMAERGLDEVFAACGVSHLVAVSGGHLVLVAALGARLLARTRLPAVARAAVLLLLTGGFVMFCGAPSSAVRAWAMSVVAALAPLVGRRPHPLSAASAAALAMALVDPGVTGQLGYLLSVLCVCGICALGAYARYLVRIVLPRPAGARSGPRAALARLRADAEEALALTLVSQLVTMPLTCATFAQLSLVAPLANVVLAPLFSALLALGLAAAALVWAPPLQLVALIACDAVGGALMALLRVLAGLPLACVPVSVEEGPALLALAVLLALLLLWWPRASRRVVGAALAVLLSCALVWVGRWRLLAPARVVVLDVGQGDAILVTDGPAAVLVDTGPGDAVVEALARANVFHLDAVVLTHLHADHAGGLDDVLAAVPVGRVLVPEATDLSELPGGCAVEEVGYGDALGVGRFSLEVISPVEPAGGEGNEGSLELLLSFDDGARTLTGLLAADAEVEETSAAVERGDVGDVDFLKVGHHGSEASLDAATAAALAPEVSVASAGEGNSYGHPDPACVEVLEGSGSVFLCTIWAGDVTVEPGAQGPVVSCQKGGEP